MYKLVQGSAESAYGSRPAFFEQHKNGLNLHFATVAQLQDNKEEHCYYRLNLKEDFVRVLQDFGRPPFNSVNEPLEEI